jgi:hypothetical protein
MQVGLTGFSAGHGVAEAYYAGSNAYYDGSNWRYTANGYAAYCLTSSGNFAWQIAPSGTAGNAISFTQAMTLDAAGNLFVGATAQAFAEKFRMYGNYAVFDNASYTGFIGQGSTLGTATASDFAIRSSNALAFLTGGATERARITAGGDLLVGTTSASDNANVGIKNIYSATAPYVATVGSASTNGTVAHTLYSTGAAAFRFYVGYGGTVYATNTTISAISDQRYKENIRDLDAGLDAVMALKPRKFDWKEGKGKDIKNDRGFIAQEFEQVFPDLVDEWKDPAPEGEEPYKSVRQDLIPVLVKAIQEQQAMINELKAEIAALKGA